MKKLSALLLAFMLLAAACGSDSGSTEASTDNAADATADATADETAVEEPAAAVDEPAAAADAAASDEAAAPAIPERIVSISPTATEILFAIGAGDRVVAVDVYSYFPEEAPVTELDGFSPNVEAIAAYEPDLVVMQGSGDVAAALEAIGVTVVVQGGPASLEDVYSQIRELGEATGNTQEAIDLEEEMSTEIDDLLADAPSADGLSYYHELDNTLYSITSSTFIGEIYALFGLTNVADPADSDGSSFGYPQLSDEFLVDADPDLIFLADTLCCAQNAEVVAERPGWDQLSAVKNANVIELNDDVVSRWGPRLVDFVGWIADALHGVAAQG